MIVRTILQANPSTLRWFCRATVDITKFSAFNLVTFPKVENFRVGQEGGKFSSKVDKFVHISVEPDTFEEDGTLSLEVRIVRNLILNHILVIIIIKSNSY